MKRPGKFMVVAVVAILLLGLFLAVGCERCGICGRYINEDLPDIFIRIDSDGSCIGYEFMAGRWKIYDDKMLITSIRGPYVYDIQENRLVDMNGWVWVKEGT
jgi:hypothetical protein